jgi:hypothetical protein
MRLIIVDPQNDPRLVEWITTKAVADDKQPFNVFSILDYGYRLDKLAPLNDFLEYLKEDETGDTNSIQFDQKYAQYILGNDEAFIAFMSIMSKVIDEEDTIVISNYNSPALMPIIDSLLKLIQQRYGINAFIVNTIEDLESIHLKYNEFGSYEQHLTFVNDVERFSKLTKQPIITATQKEIEEDMECMYESMQTEAPLVTQQVPNY